MSLILSGNSGSSTLDSSNGLSMATWTTSGRPTSPTTGQMGYNTTYGGVEVYNGSAWDTITGGPAFLAYLSTTQNIPANTSTKIQFNTKTYDTANAYDASTNYRFTPPVAGYYSFSMNAEPDSTSSNPIGGAMYVYKNGTSFFGSTINGNANGPAQASLSGIVYLNGTTDYIESWISLVPGTGTLKTDAYYNGTFFSAFLARSA